MQENSALIETFEIWQINMEVIQGCLHLTLREPRSLVGILVPILVIPSAMLFGGIFVFLIYLICKCIIRNRNKHTTSNQYVVNENTSYAVSELMVSLNSVPCSTQHYICTIEGCVSGKTS